MILTRLGPLTAYRMRTPPWATAPTSGAGAAAHGGRTHRPGTQALYLVLEPETAVRECQQLSPLMPPGTLISYAVRLAPVADHAYKVPVAVLGHRDELTIARSAPLLRSG